MQLMFMLLSLLGVASANTLLNLILEEWKTFKMTYNKSYGDSRNEMYRMKVFAQNRYDIEKHNQRYLQGLTSFRLKQNEYADLTHSEFVKVMNGYNATQRTMLRSRGATFIPPSNSWIPNRWDWRQYGAVTKVKKQGNCGCCWAFSVTGALEAQHFFKTNKLVSLSEQNLLDCTRFNDNTSCVTGGYVEDAYEYIVANGGIDTERSYPYKAVEDQCRFIRKNVGATAVGYTMTLNADEVMLKTAVATVGPIAVVVDASLISFRHYSGSVYYDEECDSSKLNHAMLIVGYGKRKIGGEYWLVKNSWGTSWGLKGYMMLARNRQNHCGIASAATYPLV